MSWLLVERPHFEDDGLGNISNIEDAVECSALSFDGGSLICFEDEAMTRVKAAFSPGGWLRARWDTNGEVCT